MVSATVDLAMRVLVLWSVGYFGRITLGGILALMLLVPLLLACAKISPPSIELLDQLAQSRDVAKLTSYLELTTTHNPFRLLKTNGAYESGKFGWHALELVGGDQKLVVFSTPLTTEDNGELVFIRNGDKLTYLPESDALGIRVVSHAFKVELHPTTSVADLKDRLTLAKTEKAGSWFLFRMSPEYKVQSIKMAGALVPFRQAGGVVTLATPTAAQFSLDITYRAVERQYGFAGSIDNKEAQLTNSYWYPMIARWPAPYTISVTAPANWTVVAQGEKTGREVLDDRATTSYKMDLPVSYYSLSAGPYHKGGIVGQGIPITNYSPEHGVKELQDAGAFYQPILNFYSATFGKYLFSSYGVLATSRYGGGALEAYSYNTAGDFKGEDSHEPAHTWFGGMLDNSYLHSYWNESFAVYCEGLYARNAPLGNKTERGRAFWRHPRITPDYNEDSVALAGADAGPVASTMGYGKGAYVLQMLESIIGTETMIKCMREWVTTQPKGVPTEWEDFTKIVDKSQSRDLSGFWKDWLYTPGYAKMSINSVKASGTQVTGKIHFDGDVRHIPVEVYWEAEGGTRGYANFYTQPDDSGDYPFTLDLPQHPKLVSFDPWLKIIRQFEKNEQPVNAMSATDGLTRYQDRRAPNYFKGFGPAGSIDTLPDSLKNLFIVGHPDHIPALAPLCVRAGFKVVGNKLTYKDTTIDLQHGGAIAIVPINETDSCVIALGTVRYEPKIGDSTTAVFDEYGRFLSGEASPKRSGNWVFSF